MSLFRFQFAPRMMSREQAAYYITQDSIRDLDRLRELKEITPKGKGRRVQYDIKELDAYADRIPERPATRGQSE